MNSHILLSEADKLRLKLLAAHGMPPPFPDAPQQQVLRKIHSKASISDDPAELSHCVGFDDAVVLSDPGDPRDSFAFSIVMPRDADVDHDRISILTPISMAVIGRSIGDPVKWETPAGRRAMVVASVIKCGGEPSADHDCVSQESRAVAG